MNNLANECKCAHKPAAIVMVDTDGYVQAGALFNLDSNDDMEGLHDAIKQMGVDSIMFVLDSLVVMESSVHGCNLNPLGFWTEESKQIGSVGTVYHVDGKQFFINDGE